MVTRIRTTISILTFVLALDPGIASAEGFADLYGGIALGNSTDAAHQNFGDPSSFPSVPLGSTTKQLSFDSSGMVGVRGGYWLEPLPWLGLAADLSYFQRKAPSADIDLVPLSFLVMLRYPMLTSEQYGFDKALPSPYS